MAESRRRAAHPQGPLTMALLTPLTIALLTFAPPGSNAHKGSASAGRQVRQRSFKPELGPNAIE
jgi:hypothetical protein